MPKVGMKVVPHQKTGWGTSLDECLSWKEAKKINQSYLYIIGQDSSGDWILWHEMNENKFGDPGNFFKEIDFIQKDSE